MLFCMINFMCEDCNGAQIAEPLYLNNYKQVPLDALHDYTYKAFICIED